MKSKLKSLCVLILFGLVCCGCGRKAIYVQGKGPTLLSREIKDEIRKVTNSVVGIHTDVTYEIHEYQYDLEDGQLVPDPESPAKYRLALNSGQSGILIDKDENTLTGGGLIIYQERETTFFAILTSNHLVAPKDTTDVYYLDDNGLPTDVLFARYILKDVNISVRVNNNWRARAQLVASDAANDLAVISVQTRSSLGVPFQNPLGYSLDLSWGDWVFVFGYPSGIKQMTAGWVSESPYRNALSVDASVRFGYSGGPVLAVSEEDASLRFVGVIKSVPRRTLDYVAPDGTLPVGFRMTADKLNKLKVKTEFLVEYGTAYFVNPATIKRFFQEKRRQLERARVNLQAKYYGR